MQRTIAMAALMVLGGCQMQTSTSWPKRGGGAAGDGAPVPEAQAGEPGLAATGDGASQELAFVAGVRTPMANVYLVNLMPDPDVKAGSIEPGDESSYCPHGEDAPAGAPQERSPNTDLLGLTVDEAVDKLTALGRYCVIVVEDTDCTDAGGVGHICQQWSGDEPDMPVSMRLVVFVRSDVRDAGKPSESHRVPELANRPADEALADLTKRGFTHVTVVDGAGCERGMVCSAAPRPDTFVGLDTEITLQVRPAKKH
jgi:hypothetical protein